MPLWRLLRCAHQPSRRRPTELIGSGSQPALQDVIDVGGAEVPDKEHRKGRRSTILLPAPAGLEDVVEERKAKYMEWLESDEADSSSEDESSSDE